MITKEFIIDQTINEGKIKKFLVKSLLTSLCQRVRLAHHPELVEREVSLPARSPPLPDEDRGKISRNRSYFSWGNPLSPHLPIFSSERSVQ